MQPPILAPVAIASVLASHRASAEPVVHVCDAGPGRIAAVSCGLVRSSHAEVIAFGPSSDAARLRSVVEATAAGVRRDWFGFFENVELEAGRFTITPKLVSPVHAPRGVVASVMDGLRMDPPAFFEVTELQAEGPYRLRDTSMTLRAYVMELTIGCSSRASFVAWMRDVLPAILLRASPTTVLNEVMDAAWRDDMSRAA